ncbi:MAG: LamG-like jellyroll fold domain-containing protein [Bacteroidota bacterium]
MKKILLFSLFFTSFLVKAQIASYNDAAQNTFNGIGGYSFSQVFFTGGVQGNPYEVSGPSPQNDFNFTASAEGGIQNVYTYISTQNVNKSILFEFKGNNVKKFGCRATAINIPTGQATNEVIIFQANTNLGGIVAETVSSTGFVGFNVTGGENVYIVSVSARFQSPSTNSIGINNIIVGDNTPQNVALNFDGVDDYVSIPSTVGNFTTNQDFTVECWVKPDAMQTTQSGQNPDENDIVGKWAGLGAGANNNYPFVIRYLNQTRSTVSERGKILVGQWDGTTFTTLISTTAVNDGKWHHVAFVRESGTFKLYINGNLEGSVADNVNNATNNTTPLQFGRRGNNESYFKGEIDEVRIWNIAKTQPEIQTNRFCKDPDSNFMAASYNASNGVPHGNNALITQLQDIIGGNNATLNNFAKTGDVSNFVTGQVKYVNPASEVFQDGSSWERGFWYLQDALSSNTCNDLFDVYVSRGVFKPSNSADINASFKIQSGQKIYGGFLTNEKSINQRNLALIQTTNETTLSGDLNGNDTQFVFTTNRGDNSIYPVNIIGNNVVFDGFTVSGSINFGAGIQTYGTNATIKNCRIIDNTNFGLNINGGNATIANCSMMGNESIGILISNSTAIIKECLIANNGLHGIDIFVSNGTRQTTITNSTIASNSNYGINVFTSGGTTTNTLKNSLIYGNASGGISTGGGGTINNTITYSLVQGVTTGTGNLNGNAVNPQFVSAVASGTINDLGNYRLKDSSPCINVGDDVGVSPLDLDRNTRPKGGKTDMGAYESNINMNEIISIATGNWESNTTWNLNRIPLATDKVILNTPFSVTVTTNTAKAKIVEQKPSSDLKFNSGGSLELNQ